MTEFRCIVCDRPLLRTLPAYERLPRVTSDCKPWPAGGQLADFVTRLSRLGIRFVCRPDISI